MFWICICIFLLYFVLLFCICLCSESVCGLKGWWECHTLVFCYLRSVILNQCNMVFLRWHEQHSGASFTVFGFCSVGYASLYCLTNCFNWTIYLYFVSCEYMNMYDTKCTSNNRLLWKWTVNYMCVKSTLYIVHH